MGGDAPLDNPVRRNRPGHDRVLPGRRTAIRGGTMTRTVLVTGATAGFGEATARRFSKAGWNVIITGRRADRLERLAGELGPERVHAATFDIRDADAIDAALAALPEQFRGVDVLVNNAGLALGT